jgi:hypothetical protein
MRQEAFTRAPAGRANSGIRVRLNIERPQVVLPRRAAPRRAYAYVPPCSSAALCVDDALPLRACREGPGVLVAAVAGLRSFLVRVS